MRRWTRSASGLLTAGTAGFTITASMLAPVAAFGAASVDCFDHPATIVGTPDDDVIAGTAGPDIIAGLAGNDRIDGLGGDDIICGDAGSDELRGGDGNDFIHGGANAPMVADQPLPEEIWGGRGDDVMAGAGGDTPDDPSAVDRVHYDDATRPMLIDLTDTDYGDAVGQGDDLITQFEVVYGSAYDDTMYGSGGEWDPMIDPEDTTYDDRFYGLAGDDYLLGRGGRDELYGGAGNDDVIGGAEIDGLHGGSGADRISGGLGDDLANGDAGDDVVDGDEDADLLDGGAGDDRVRGGDDSDILSDPSGLDVADAGPDSGYCSSAFETRINCRLVFDERSAARRTQAASTSAAEGSVATRCRGEEATIVGTTGRDRILGTPGPDVISAGPGFDTIRGRGGDDLICAGPDWDYLYGGDGNDGLYGGADGFSEAAEAYLGDHIWGGAGDDVFDVGQRVGPNVAYFTDSPGPIRMDGDTVTGFGSDVLVNVRRVVGSAYDDVMLDGDDARWLSGFDGDDTMSGGGGDDDIAGNLGNDVIAGGSGDDELAGYEGADRVTGGSGSDFLSAFGDGDLLLGGSGDDVFDSSLGNRGFAVSMVGGLGDDRFYGGQGVEVVNGGWHRAGDACFKIASAVGCEFVRSWP